MKQTVQAIAFAIVLSAASAHAAEQSNGSAPNGISPNRIATNKLAANGVSPNRIASNKLASNGTSGVAMTLIGKGVPPPPGRDARCNGGDGAACEVDVFRALAGQALAR